MELTLKQKAAFGIGAVGKDMVYALSASYVMYFYQDVLGLSATFVGLILMAARVFDPWGFLNIELPGLFSPSRCWISLCNSNKNDSVTILLVLPKRLRVRTNAIIYR